MKKTVWLILQGAVQKIKEVPHRRKKNEIRFSESQNSKKKL
jgi:hypothetical protein